jgi:hypothetical protein
MTDVSSGKAPSKSYLARRASTAERQSSNARKTAIQESLGVILVPSEHDVKRRKSGGSILAAMQHAGKQAFTTPRRSVSEKSGKKQSGASAYLNDPFIDALLGCQTIPPTQASNSPRGPRRLLIKRTTAMPVVSSKRTPKAKSETNSGSVSEMTSRTTYSGSPVPASISTMKTSESSASLSERSNTSGLTRTLKKQRRPSCGFEQDDLGGSTHSSRTTRSHSQATNRRAIRSLNQDMDQDACSVVSARSRRGRDSKIKSSRPTRTSRSTSALRRPDRHRGESVSSHCRRLHCDDPGGDWGNLEFDDLEENKGALETPYVHDNFVGAIESDYVHDVRTANVVGENLMTIGAQLVARGHELKQAARRGSMDASKMNDCNQRSWEREEYLEEHAGSPIESRMVPQVVYQTDPDDNDAESDIGSNYLITDAADTSSAASFISFGSIDDMMEMEDDDEIHETGLDFSELHDAAFDPPDDNENVTSDNGLKGNILSDSWRGLQFEFSDLNVASEKKKSKKKSRGKVGRSKSGEGLRPLGLPKVQRKAPKDDDSFGSCEGIPLTTLMRQMTC